MPESNNPFAEVKAVFFDLDDTLCGYWNASKKGLRETFDAHPVPGKTTDEMVKHWAVAFRKFSPTLKKTGYYAQYLVSGEVTRTQQMRLTLAEAGIEDESLAVALSEAYMRRRDANLALFEESLPVLEALKGTYPMGLITNGPADIQRQEVGTLKLASYFNPILIEGELGFGKPVPEVFRRAEAAVGLEPHQILMVGNSLHHDIFGAMDAGWRTAWVRRDSDVPPSAEGDAVPEPIPTEGPLPDMIIESLDELLPLLLPG